MRLAEAKGDWALVTGASSGIGEEFCGQLAEAGMHLVMGARRKERMEDLAERLAARFDTKSRIVVQDLSRPDAALAVKEAVAAQGVRIRLLVNNAAFGRWGRFETAGDHVYEEMIRLNANTVVALCRCFLPDLVSFPRSAIINVSSPAACQPVPYMAVYAASKAFVSSFGQALYEEFGERGLLVQTLLPGPTRTEQTLVPGSCPAALAKQLGEPEKVVRLSLRHLSSKRPVAVAAKCYFRQRLIAGLLPTAWVIQAVARMFRPPEEELASPRSALGSPAPEAMRLPEARKGEVHARIHVARQESLL